jgi:peptidoglycan-associated lipoprotein
MKRIAIQVLVLLTAACSTPLPPAAPPPASTRVPAPQAAAPASLPPAKPAPVAQTESPMRLFEHVRDTMANKSIYFDYDQYAIKPDGTSLLMEQAKVAITYPEDHITVQGNCDERGGSEYNLALGQRRADEVKEQLVMLGVPAARIETISFGKEKPRELCHEEKCWAENRRADFVDAWK